MICEYCGSTDGEESKYHKGTCGHCGAKLSVVLCYFFGKPVTSVSEYEKIIKSDWISISYTITV